jgi:FkbM family methyltransferase
LAGKIKNFFKTLSRLKLTGALKFYTLKYFKGEDKNIHLLKLRSGQTLSVNKNTGDLTTLFEIFINDDYKFSGSRNSKLKIIDIGANIGFFSIYAAVNYPASQIYSFEPYPPTYARLIDNLRRNNIKNVKPFPYAVSDKAGCNTMLTGTFDEGLYETTEVDSISFESIFEMTGERKFDMAKIDCEGSEYGIILNSSPGALQNINEFVIEVHEVKGFDKNDLIKRFHEIGYETHFAENLLKAKHPV